LLIFFLVSGDQFEESPNWESDYYDHNIEPYSIETNLREKSHLNSHYNNYLFAGKLMSYLSNTLLLETIISYYNQVDNFGYDSHSDFKNQYVDEKEELLGSTIFINELEKTEKVDNKFLEIKNELTTKIGISHEVESGFYFQAIDLFYNVS